MEAGTREPSPHIKASRSGRAGIVHIARPKALNSMNLEMVNTLTQIYKDWENDPSVKIIIMKSEERAFCSGGDVVSLYKALRGADDINTGSEFFRREYEFNYLLHTLRRTHVALTNGIVMGGGAGISVNGHFVVGTEKTIFAMPEVNIGFIPDVGSSYFLSRLKGHVGTYLAVSGRTLSAYDVKKAGLATHYVQSKNLEQLQRTLETIVSKSYTDQDNAIHLFEESQPVTSEGVLEEHGGLIQSAFSQNTVSEILSVLEKDESAFAKDTVKAIRSASPMSVHLALCMQKRGAKMSFADCLQMEYNVSLNCLKSQDFYEGVRAVLVDKTRDAKWSHDMLESVSPDSVEAYFRPTPGIPPLNLDLQRKPSRA